MRKMTIVLSGARIGGPFDRSRRQAHSPEGVFGPSRCAGTESLTTVGTPDCHVQGRLLRIVHHCPPAAVTAAPR